ncbi:MAG: lycopene cyclase domain-containing protein [Cryomorphaceae bacterium]|nr:lycopene cyclase domain-containing protein [Cryomorphaceae bacterium]
MLETEFLYLAINIFTISVPLIRGFEPRIQFARSFVHLLPAIAIVGGVFIVWDAWFTYMGVWGFTQEYLTGLNLINLPIEEWLFFITVPTACVFIYRVLNYFWPKPFISEKVAWQINMYLAFFAVAMAVMNTEKWYTGINFGLLAIYLFYLQYLRKPTWLPHFYRAYLVALVPFFIVNGILTGTGLETQVVWYNDDHNLGIRMVTIPFEDTFYGMLLVMGVVDLYERFSNNAYHSVKN